MSACRIRRVVVLTYKFTHHQETSIGTSQTKSL